jgi:undecaprenyl phosphate-alpha-L-ara4N flippase subunit ArnE
VSNRPIGVGFVGLAVVLEAVSQVAFKKAAGRPGAETRGLVSLRAALVHPWLIPGVVFAVLQVIASTLALRFLPVSVAFPLGSLELVVMTLMANSWLGETVTLRRWAGVALLLLGTALVGSS